MTEARERHCPQVWEERWRAGDEDAFAQLFDYYRPSLRNMVQLRIGTALAARIDASDVMQESFLDARHKAADYRWGAKVEFYVWLRGIARDRLLKMQRMHLGTQKRAIEREIRLPNQSSMILARQLLARDNSPSQDFRREEIRHQLHTALQSLSETDLEVILMRHFERLSNSQVAQALEISPSGAAMRHGRALARLKDVLSSEISQGDLA